MSDAHSPVEFTAEEIRYRDSGGEVPLPHEGPADAPREQAGKPDPADDDHELAAAEAEDSESEVAENAGEADDGRRRPRKVAYGAFVKQKNEAAEARRQAEEFRVKYAEAERNLAVQNARIEERIRHYQASQQGQQPQDQKPTLRQAPDPNENPLDYMRWQDERAAFQQQQIEELRSGVTATTEAQRQAQALAQLDSAYRADMGSAFNETPAAREAYDYMIATTKDLIRAEYNGQIHPSQVDAEVIKRERLTAHKAMGMGKRPAQYIMELAWATGWRPKQARQQQQPADGQAQQAAADAEQAKIDAVARGQNQNRSLSSAGRPGGSAATMTIEKFGEMSDEDRYAWIMANPSAHARLGGMQ